MIFCLRTARGMGGAYQQMQGDKRPAETVKTPAPEKPGKHKPGMPGEDDQDRASYPIFNTQTRVVHIDTRNQAKPTKRPPGTAGKHPLSIRHRLRALFIYIPQLQIDPAPMRKNRTGAFLNFFTGIFGFSQDVCKTV